MVSLTIQLNDPYLALPNNKIRSPTPPSTLLSSSTSTSCSIDPQVAFASSFPGATLLKGSLIVSLSKPIKVASIVLVLNGSSHLAIAGGTTNATNTAKLANYARQHLRIQIFIIKPSPDPDQFTLLQPPSSPSALQTSSVASNSNISGKPNQIVYPFEIPVPNSVPVSVTTPQGGTTYQLTAELTMSSNGGSSGSSNASRGSNLLASLLSAAAAARFSSSVAMTTLTVRIYRIGFMRSLCRWCCSLHRSACNGGGHCDNVEIQCSLSPSYGQQQPCHSDQEGQGSAPFPSSFSSSFSSFSSSSYADTSITAPTTIANDTVNEAADSDNDEDENCMIPGSISYTWPGILAATVSVPFVHLPLKSKPDLRVQIRLLHVDTDMTVKSFQAALWERAIFRVLRTTVNKKQGGNATESLKEAGRAKKQWITAGVRERVISTQRTEKGWTVFSTSPAVAADRGARVIDRSVSFTTPNPIRGPNELYSSRNCNASTYSRIPRSERYLHGEDASMTNSHPDNDPEVEYEYGAIEIEIQHFLRFSIAVTGTGTVSESKTGRGGGGAVERDLGDIPVVVCGIPGEPACDGTGLPTYMGSFSTSSPSLEETHRYEAAQARDSMNLDLARLSIEGFAGRDSAQYSMHSTSSIASHPGTLMLLPEDYESDDAYMAVMGLRRTSIPPEYEANTAWQSLDSSAGEMQQSGVYTDSSSSHSQDH